MSYLVDRWHVPQYFNDNGYTKICVKCDNHWGVDRGLMGKERFIEIKVCPSCEKAAEKARQALRDAPRLGSRRFYDVVKNGVDL